MKLNKKILDEQIDRLQMDACFYQIREIYFIGKAEAMRCTDGIGFIFENHVEVKCFYEVYPK